MYFSTWNISTSRPLSLEVSLHADGMMNFGVNPENEGLFGSPLFSLVSSQDDAILKPSISGGNSYSRTRLKSYLLVDAKSYAF
jgi:hypothetical protein